MSIRTSIFLSAIAASSLAVASLAGCSMDSNAGPNNNGVSPLLLDLTDVPVGSSSATCADECEVGTRGTEPDGTQWECVEASCGDLEQGSSASATCVIECDYDGQTGTDADGRKWSCVEYDCESAPAAGAVAFLQDPPKGPKGTGKGRRKKFENPESDPPPPPPSTGTPKCDGKAKDNWNVEESVQWANDTFACIAGTEQDCRDKSGKLTSFVNIPSECKGQCANYSPEANNGVNYRIPCGWDPDEDGEGGHCSPSQPDATWPANYSQHDADKICSARCKKLAKTLVGKKKKTASTTPVE